MYIAPSPPLCRPQPIPAAVPSSTDASSSPLAGKTVVVVVSSSGANRAQENLHLYQLAAEEGLHVSVRPCHAATRMHHHRNLQPLAAAQGAGGAGRALAFGAAVKGAKVVIANRSVQKAADLAAQVCRAGQRSVKCVAPGIIDGCLTALPSIRFRAISYLHLSAKCTDPQPIRPALCRSWIHLPARAAWRTLPAALWRGMCWPTPPLWACTRRQACGAGEKMEALAPDALVPPCPSVR